MNLSDKFESALQPVHIFDNNRNNKRLIAGAAISGFIAGFAAAIMLAPESGSEFREDLSKILQETNEKLMHLASETIKKSV